MRVHDLEQQVVSVQTETSERIASFEESTDEELRATYHAQWEALVADQRGEFRTLVSNAEASYNQARKSLESDCVARVSSVSDSLQQYTDRLTSSLRRNAQIDTLAMRTQIVNEVTREV